MINKTPQKQSAFDSVASANPAVQAKVAKPSPEREPQSSPPSESPAKESAQARLQPHELLMSATKKIANTEVRSIPKREQEQIDASSPSALASMAAAFERSAYKPNNAEAEVIELSDRFEQHKQTPKRLAKVVTKSLTDSTLSLSESPSKDSPPPLSNDVLLSARNKNTILKSTPEREQQPMINKTPQKQSAFDSVASANPAVQAKVAKPSPEREPQSSPPSESPAKESAQARLQPHELLMSATKKIANTEVRSIPKREQEQIDASSPSALASMAAAFERSAYKPVSAEAEVIEQSNRFEQHKQTPTAFDYSHYAEPKPTPGNQHHYVRWERSHGVILSLFLISSTCEITQFMNTWAPSTFLRLANLILSISLCAGIIDPQVQRSPLGMMLNRLAAWIVALIALSSSVYTTPGKQWLTGEVHLINMIGTLLFPLAVLDSASVLWAQIRSRNFILKGFVVESMCLYCFLLGVPIARFILGYEKVTELYVNHKVAETIYAISLFTAFIIAIEYYCVCQIAAGKKLTKEVWSGFTTLLWGLLHAQGCAFLVALLNGVLAGGFFYTALFAIFFTGRLLELALEKTGWLQYRILPHTPGTAGEKTS